jgi:hypothetical protein
MQPCPQCGTPLWPGAATCTICGRPQAPPGAVPPAGPPTAAYPPPTPPGRASGGVSPRILVGCGLAVIVAFTLLGVAVVRNRTNRPAARFEAISVDGVVGTPTTGPPATTSRTTGTTRKGGLAAWEPWTSPDRSFTLDFPDEPEITERDLDTDVIEESTRAAASDATGSFAVDWSDLADPKYATDTTRLLNVFLDARWDPAKVTYQTRQPTRVGGLPALEYTATSKVVPGTTIMGVVLVARTRVFELSVLSLPGATPDFDRFRDSFRLAKAA